MSAAASNGAVIQGLKTVLSNTYLLALKTHGFHWNVEGANFPQLHELFNTQYQALFNAADEVAERLRALGEAAPGSFAQFSKLAHVKEETNKLAAPDMIKQLLGDYETLVKDAHETLHAADLVEDEATNDLLAGLSREWQKTSWMLRAMV
jgi:starvation-inducible DNA-binding protein